MDDIKTVEVPLRVVRVYAQCRKCGARLGEPIPLYSGLALGNDGTWKRVNDHAYLYKCPQCGEETESDELFPRIEYREIEET